MTPVLLRVGRSNRPDFQTAGRVTGVAPTPGYTGGYSQSSPPDLLTNKFTHSLTHSLTHPLTHSSIQAFKHYFLRYTFT